MKNTYVCIMAGGSGERFWPLSRKVKPKHLLKLFSDKTLIEETVRRVEGLVPIDNVFILTNETQIGEIRNALPFLQPEQVIAESAKRDTAPAAALATAIALRGSADATLALLPADSMIKDVKTFQDQFQIGLGYARENPALVTFAITPTYPATGFGYIELAQQQSSHIYSVGRFVEKPDLSNAREYLASGRFGWNSGMFIWKASSFLTEARKQQPALGEFIEQFPKTGDYSPYLLDRFPRLPKISVDYAIMENASHVTAIKTDFDWDDVGSWDALPRHLGKDTCGNTFKGSVASIDSSANIAFSSGRTIALCGVDNLVVVETADAILVCHLDKVQNIKRLLEKIPQQLL